MKRLLVLLLLLPSIAFGQTSLVVGSGTGSSGTPIQNGTNTYLLGVGSNNRLYNVAPTFPASTIAVGTPLTGGTANCLLYDLTNTLACALTGNNGVWITNGSGVPSNSTTLPDNLAMQTPASINLSNGTNLPLSGIASIANNTVLANVSGGSASPSAKTLTSYTVENLGYSTINAAVAAIGSTPAELVIGKNYTLTASLTIPSTLKLTILNGGGITKASTYTLTINGPLEAGIYQIFSGFGVGDITFNYANLGQSYLEWWGCVADAVTDCLPAWNRAEAAVPVIKMQQASYSFSDTPKITRENFTLLGTRGTSLYDAPNNNTIIMNNSATATGFQVGPDSDPGSVADFLTGIVVKDIDIYRTAGPQPANPGSEFSGPKGFVAQYVKFPVFENIRTSQDSIGFAFNGTVGAKSNKLFAHRDRVGTGPNGNGVNDYFYGIWMNGNAVSHLAGGNASTYISYSNTELGGSAVLGTTIGFYADAAWSDTFLDFFETSAVQYGVWFAGNGSGGSLGTNLDGHIRNPILDQCAIVCLRVTDTNPYGQLTISGAYAAPASGATAAVSIENSGGTTVITGTKSPAGAAGPIGLNISTSSGVISSGNSFVEFSVPVSLNTVSSSSFADIINNQTQAATNAISATAVTKSIFAPIIKGAANKFTNGLNLVSTGNTANEVNLSGLNTSAISGSNLLINSIAVTANGNQTSNYVSGYPNSLGGTTIGGGCSQSAILTVCGNVSVASGGVVYSTGGDINIQGQAHINLQPSGAPTTNIVDPSGFIQNAGTTQLKGYTVSTLPSTAGAGKVTGATAYVTDATACSYGGALTGGASTFCKVVYNGSAWVGN